MADQEPRILESIVLTRLGRVIDVPGSAVGVEVVDAAGAEILPIRWYLRELIANGNSPATARSYAMDLLRWWRFLAAIDVTWDSVGRTERTDFILWMRSAAPRRGSVVARRAKGGFAPRTINHSNAVLRGFYDFHIDHARGPLINPFAGRNDLAQAVRANAHHNPDRPWDRGARGAGQQKVPRAMPRSIPERTVDELLAGLTDNRDRALIVFYLSTGARPSELLDIRGEDLNWGEKLVRVRRKGSQAPQWLPASNDAFVWLRLYLGTLRLEQDDHVWMTLRKPRRPLNYHAMRAVFMRAGTELGEHYTLHQLRHTAAYRMMQDPNLSLSDVQWVLGHASLGTTQIYTVPVADDVISRVREFHARAASPKPPPVPAAGYDADTMRTLFGEQT